MPSNYWLKLYHELLHDPKMAQLDSDTWRRCIEMFLFAGEHGTRQGYLPSITDMAWILHVPDAADLWADIEDLKRLGFLSEDEDERLYVTNWERQQATPDNRNSGRYHAWRKAVLERDDWTCGECGYDGHGGESSLHAHHIWSWAGHPETRFNLENGVALCAPCHREYHRRMRAYG